MCHYQPAVTAPREIPREHNVAKTHRKFKCQLRPGSHELVTGFMGKYAPRSTLAVLSPRQRRVRACRHCHHRWPLGPAPRWHNATPAPRRRRRFRYSKTIPILNFGTAFPATPYYRLPTIGVVGCDGAPNGSFDYDGNPGLPGQAGGQISTVNTTITIFGGHAIPPDETRGADIVSRGGMGGAGSDGRQSDRDRRYHRRCWGRGWCRGQHHRCSSTPRLFRISDRAGRYRTASLVLWRRWRGRRASG